MPELRKDPIVGRWVIIATERAKRPLGPKVEPVPISGGFFPFFGGDEQGKPPQNFLYPHRNTRPHQRGWRGRAGPDKIPPLQNEGVLDTPIFVSLAPFASRFPFETWILPKNHNSHFENIQKTEVDELGTVLKTILLKLETALDKPAYNYIIHTAPFDTQSLPHYHWHIEVIPRLTRVAGFEWGTGFYINPVPPEQAADYLRQTEVDVSAKPAR